jgi:hypothetical protein
MTMTTGRRRTPVAASLLLLLLAGASSQQQGTNATIVHSRGASLRSAMNWRKR